MNRLLALCAGGALLALAWSGVVPLVVPAPFTAHMIVHVTIVAFAAPLIALGLAGGAADPTRRWPIVAAPLVAMLLEFLVVWGWHLPALHLAARTTAAALVAEQLSFLAVGLLLWFSALGGPAGRRPNLGIGVLALLMTSMHMTLLGVLITLAPRTLYHHAISAAAVAPLLDQQIAGMVMLFGGATSYLIGGLYLVARLLQDPKTRQVGEEHASLG